MRGHMRQRGKGTWELRVFAGRDPVNGRDRYKTKTVKGGKRAAEDALAAFITQVGAGVATSGTFGELVERWFEVASVARDWSPKTVMKTRRIIDKQLGPLWALRLDRVRTSVLDSYYRRRLHVPPPAASLHNTTSLDSVDNNGWRLCSVRRHLTRAWPFGPAFPSQSC